MESEETKQEEVPVGVENVEVENPTEPKTDEDLKESLEEAEEEAE